MKFINSLPSKVLKVEKKTETAVDLTDFFFPVEFRAMFAIS